MPHLQIDDSAYLEHRLDVAGLCRVLRDAAVATGIVPLAGIRVRATKADRVVIANGNPRHAYLDIQVRLRGGRADAAKAEATAAILAAAEAYCAEAMEPSSFMLSMVKRDIHQPRAVAQSQLDPKLPAGRCRTTLQTHPE